MKYSLAERVKNGDFIFIAGPCVLDSQEKALSIAKNLTQISEKLKEITPVTFIFKGSFDKANRSELNSYRGPGIEQGMKILEKVKSEFDCFITTDIHSPEQAPYVSSIVDLIQVPAFLSRQTDLLIASGKTGRCVNIKKGQFMAPWEPGNAIEKIKAGGGNSTVFVTERGSSFGYSNLVVDMTSIVFMKKQLNARIIYDATHSSPSLYGMIGSEKFHQKRFYVPYLSRSAAATGSLDGLFMEVYDNPAEAMCDGSTSLALSDVEKMMKEVLNIWLIAEEATSVNNV
jgi:2-dehydro-3-deoxyphosphooctonate aldolase (KDO 8-P synthase)